MASVEEIKAALELERDEATELAERALQAVDTVTNLSNWWLSFLSILLAVLGLIGLAAIFFGSRRQARKVAETRINSYIKSEEGKLLIQDAISDEVDAQLADRSFVFIQPAQAPTIEDSEFPKDPKQGGG